jgi:hypothetical protein
VDKKNLTLTELVERLTDYLPTHGHCNVVITTDEHWAYARDVCITSFGAGNKHIAVEISSE